VLFVPFSDGSGFSVEFTETAPEEYPGNTLDDEHAFRGTWIEFRTNDVQGLQQKLRDAGIREFHTPAARTRTSVRPADRCFVCSTLLTRDLDARVERRGIIVG